MALLPEFGLGEQISVGVRTIFVNERSEVLIGPSFFDYVLPKGLKVLERSFEGCKGGDRVHEGSESKPVDAFGPEQQDGGDRSLMFGNLVVLLRS